MKKNLKPLFLSILFGITGTLSLEPFSIPLLHWMVPWFLFYFGELLYKQSIKKILWYSFLLALNLCIFAFYWIIHLFVEYGGIPLFLSIFLFIPYSFLLNSKIPLILLFFAKIKKSYKLFYQYNFISIPLVITIIDIITPQVFNWYWGNAVTQNQIFIQIADIVGIHGLTFFYILFSYVFYRIFRLIYKNYKIIYNKKFQRLYVPIIFILFLIHVYGIIQIYRYKNILHHSDKIRVALIQPNAPLEKYGENKVTLNILEKLMLNEIPILMEEAFKNGEGKIDLLILPESAVPYFTTQKNSFTINSNSYHPYFEYLIHYGNAKFNVDIFFNEFYYEWDFKTLHVYNSSSLFSRRGKREAIYHKRKLIPFGEQIPMAEFLDSTGLIQLVPESVRYSRFKAGKEFNAMPYMLYNYYTPLEEERDFTIQPLDEILNETQIKMYFKDRSFQPHGYFMPLICYEIIQPEYVRNFFNEATHPIDFIVNITQDKWYGKTIESYQHMVLGKIRSIELRRSIVRSTNSGVSASIDPLGNYLKPIYGNQITQQETSEIQIFDIPIMKQHKTIYSMIGSYWIYVLIILFVLAHLKNIR